MNSLPQKQQSRLHVWIVLALMATGAFFRISGLDLAAFRADTILLWGLIQRNVSVWDTWTRWFEVSGAMGQMPMAAVLMEMAQSIIPGKPDPFSTLLPFAIIGVLTIPVAYWTGRTSFNPRVGLYLALLVAVHPFTVYFSREAYFYATALLGYFLYFLAASLVESRTDEGRVLTKLDVTVLGLGIFFSTYSQITGIFICVAGYPYLAFRMWRKLSGAVRKSSLIRLTVIHAVIIAPIVFVSWGYRPLLGQIFANKDYSAKLVEQAGIHTLPALGKVALQYSWGWTLPGLVLIALSLLLLLELAFRRSARPKLILPLWFIVSQIVLFLVGRNLAGAFFEPRYLAGIYPFFLGLIAFALCPEPQGGWIRLVRWVVAAAAVIFYLYPAFLITQLRGQPTPYWDIVHWTDSHLPPRTPVLVDRWFESWNEIRAHTPTNAVFTFTVPNEPVEEYIRINWRRTAMDFFERFPDAAYCEIAKEYFTSPSVGPWTWPREYFAQHVGLTNLAAIKLGRLGLAGRSEFAASDTNRLVVEIFYNTESDLVERARSAGKLSYVTFGKGWDYAKTQDYRDWRILGSEAGLNAYNLGSSPTQATITIGCACPQSAKNVTVNGTQYQIPAGSIQDWRIQNVALEPGLNTIKLLDREPSADRRPLLVNRVSIE